MSPISSRNTVPSAAASMRPILRWEAPVKAPFSCPKSSVEISVAGMPAQLIAMNGPDAKPDRS